MNALLYKLNNHAQIEFDRSKIPWKICEKFDPALPLFIRRTIGEYSDYDKNRFELWMLRYNLLFSHKTDRWLWVCLQQGSTVILARARPNKGLASVISNCVSNTPNPHLRNIWGENNTFSEPHVIL